MVSFKATIGFLMFKHSFEKNLKFSLILNILGTREVVNILRGFCCSLCFIFKAIEDLGQEGVTSLIL